MAQLSPETGKIAIKVINHYGDEVMKVYEVASASSLTRQSEAADPVH